jgi:ribosomal-protein-alanine N-acetyltransferase
MMALRIEQPVPSSADIHVRIMPMKRRHLRAVLRIEQQVYPRPWTLSIFSSEVSQNVSRCYLVAKVGHVVVGYCGALFSGEDAHVTNIAVDPAWHRHKIGTRLLAALIDQSVYREARHLTLEVRVSNVAAQEMYRQFGLAPAGVRRKYYENVEDAIVMWAHDIDSPESRARVAELVASVPGLTTFEDLR